MNWFKQSSNKDFVARVKKMLKEHPFTQAIAAYYNIPLSEIDDGLEIEIADLDGKYAEGNGKLIRLNRKVIDENFFRDGFHYVIHEFFHWLKRRSEDKFYFNDPEEIQSFVLQMSWQIVNGKSYGSDNCYDLFAVGVYETNDPNGKLRYLSEDYYFSRLWASIGGEVWADVSQPLSHFGTQQFRGHVGSMFVAPDKKV